MRALTWCFPWQSEGGDWTTDGESMVTVPNKHPGEYASGPYDEWIVWDVTEIVTDWIDGTRPNYGFLIRQFDIENPGKNQHMNFRSSETPEGASFAPQLVIDCCDDPAQTGTGFYWPTGTSEVGSYAPWLAECCSWTNNCSYIPGLYHIGWDFVANVGDCVYAISDGTVVNISQNDWGTGNVGVVVEHTLDNGDPFIAVYGHVQTELQIGNSVVAGAVLGKIGPYDPPHLHFGIRPGTSIAGPYGRMNCPDVPPIVDTNGFVNPLDWIETNTPG